MEILTFYAQALEEGLWAVLAWPAFGLMLLGVFVGFVVGILPGVGGLVALALMLPFTFTMQPTEAFALLLAMSSVTATTGDITSVLFGIPGEGTSAALVVDGYPLTKQGQAGRALGAALFSSLVGAIFGALVMLLLIPAVRPLVLTFGSPEFFALVVLGVSFIAALGGDSALKGLIAGGLGLLLASIGMDLQTGQLRYTFEQLYLWEGFNIVPVAVGLFAVPEIVDLAVRGTSIAQTSVGPLGGVGQGVRDTLRHWSLTLRCSALGTFIGIIPGLGGAVAQWIAYAHAVQTSENGERFGKGAIEGVIGPGAANNSKEGGALLTTLAFGVPGSASMALLLGAFLIVGLVPGPDMLTSKLPITFSMVWILVLANIITVCVCFLFLRHLVLITFVRGSLLIPFLLMLIYIGSYTANNHMGDLLVMLVFGLLGYLMNQWGWPRPPLLLGLILGPLAERYLWISFNSYGLSWLTFPLVLVIFGLTVAVLIYTSLPRDRQAQHP